MPKDYYYIVAGLPDIELDSDCVPPAFSEFIQEMSKLVSDRDSSLLSYLRLPYDNINLINIIEKKEAEFNMNGKFSEEELRHGMQDPEDLPEYMQLIIEAYKCSTPVHYNISWEDQLSWLFYEHLSTLGNSFLREWFLFELNMRNFIVASRCRDFDVKIEQRLEARMEQEPSQSLICINEVTESILASMAKDFSLSTSFPWIEQVMALDSSNLVSFEKGIDELRWEKLSEMALFNYFGIEVLLAYAIKLQIVERWNRLKPHRGKEIFEGLLLNMETVTGSSFVPSSGAAPKPHLEGAMI